MVAFVKETASEQCMILCVYMRVCVPEATRWLARWTWWKEPYRPTTALPLPHLVCCLAHWPHLQQSSPMVVNTASLLQGVWPGPCYNAIRAMYMYIYMCVCLGTCIATYSTSTSHVY